MAAFRNQPSCLGTSRLSARLHGCLIVLLFRALVLPLDIVWSIWKKKFGKADTWLAILAHKAYGYAASSAVANWHVLLSVGTPGLVDVLSVTHAINLKLPLHWAIRLSFGSGMMH